MHEQLPSNMLTTFPSYSPFAVPPTHIMNRFRGLQQLETEDQALACWVVISIVKTTVCMVLYVWSSTPVVSPITTAVPA